MEGASINEIDITVADHSLKPYQFSEIGRYQLVLQFEIIFQDELSAKQIKQYNDEGYSRAHTADTLSIRR